MMEREGMCHDVTCRKDLRPGFKPAYAALQLAVPWPPAASGDTSLFSCTNCCCVTEMLQLLNVSKYQNNVKRCVINNVFHQVITVCDI